VSVSSLFLFFGASINFGGDISNECVTCWTCICGVCCSVCVYCVDWNLAKSKPSLVSWIIAQFKTYHLLTTTHTPGVFLTDSSYGSFQIRHMQVCNHHHFLVGGGEEFCKKNGVECVTHVLS
jgi:hypothetical protein